MVSVAGVGLGVLAVTRWQVVGVLLLMRKITRCMSVEKQVGLGIELDDAVPFILSKIPDFDKYTIRADNARPESINHVKEKGYRR